MIFYGTNGALVRTAPLPGVACPACAAPESLQLSVFSRYAHIYWIPLFPYSKPSVVQCAHCQQAWDTKGTPAALQPAVADLKKQTRAPWWHWSGLGLIALLIAWGAVAATRDARANKAYLAAPRAGDIYTVHSPGDSTKYSLLKVLSAKGNTVELVANEYEIDNRHPLSELNSPEKYSKEPFSMTQFELQIMQNKDQIIDVDRPE
ncbi:hypothetical protein [Hymenobacter negativus]|uniref:Zinc-ribbon domain-containing protein n=1 Tax=Hymenobacter negativus TaxID=2795026 RepID=A0ABS3QAA0_9BACT|nr:hypothetical protein [Hymenobacter negativus]MBO2008179.1 hypothetical protein [Hymenobacter negativus]